MQYKSLTQWFSSYKNGTDATVMSNTSPEDTSKMWLDTSTFPPVLKYYDGTEWVMVNDQSNYIDSEIKTVTEKVGELEVTNEKITSRVSTLETTTGETSSGLSTLKESYDSYVEQTDNAISATLKSSKDYTDNLTAHAREISTYFKASEEGLRISQSDSGNEDTNRTSTLMAPDSFQVQFDGIPSTTMYREGIETGSLWLSTALTLNPLIFTGYGSGESGGVVIKWRGVD